MPECQKLPVEGRSAIFERMNLHQQRIDASWGREQAAAYADPYWSEEV